jgi:hypothetical protein
MKRAHISDVSNLDLCDLQKVGQIKNPGILSCILIRCTHDKNLEMIQFRSNITLLIFQDGRRRPYLKSDWAEIQ